MSEEQQNLLTVPELDSINSELLIELVKDHSCLFDTVSHTNKNRVAKNSAWQVIGNQLGQPALLCKTEWDKLKSTYRRKKAAVKGKSGQARGRIELWPHFFPMQFLGDYVTEASTTGNMNLEGEFSMNSTNEELLNETSGNDDQPINSDVSQTKIVSRESVPVKKPKLSDKVDEEIIKFLKKPTKETDSHDHFCAGVANQLRTLTKRQSSLVKIKISQILFDVEFNDAENHTSS